MLVRELRNGNEAAFEVMYDRHHRGILAFCRHMLGSREEGEDALQQTFVSAHGDLLRSSKEISLRAWLYTIARNRCLSLLRARREQPSEEVEPSTAGLHEQVERRGDLRDLLADMRELPEHQRAALVLAELRDLSHAEIAGVLGCEAARVKSLIFQARSSLIDSRRARETPCDQIREELATLRGGALRRNHLRRHLQACAGCQKFREDVRRQRALLAVALPVIPSLGLKHSVVAAFGGGGGGAAAGGAGGGLALKGAAAKLAIVLTAGSAAAGGVAVGTHQGLRLPGAGGSAGGGTPSAVTPAEAARALEPALALPAVPSPPGRTRPMARGGRPQPKGNGFQPLRGGANATRARAFARTRGNGRKLGLTRRRHLYKPKPVKQAPAQEAPAPQASPTPQSADPSPSKPGSPGPASTAPTGSRPTGESSADPLRSGK